MIRDTWLQMGMPITVGIVDERGGPDDIAAVRDLFDEIDRRFSPYRPDSEVCRFNAGQLAPEEISDEFAFVLQRCEQTKVETLGYFNVLRAGAIDPSGYVKGWAIKRASDLLVSRGHRNFLVDAGGDVQAMGRNEAGEAWRVGIRNPFDRRTVVKILAVSDMAVATSGTAIRGNHIYDPHHPRDLQTDIVSLTVLAASIEDADRFATAAFAMGRDGIEFIAEREGLEGYAIDHAGQALFTEGLLAYAR